MALIKDILRTMDYGPAPEGSEHVMAWLEAHRTGFGHFIDGRFAKPMRLSPRRIGWLARDARAWLDGLDGARRKVRS